LTERTLSSGPGPREDSIPPESRSAITQPLALGPTARRAALERQELRLSLIRSRRVVAYGIVIWSLSASLDWLAVNWVDPTIRLWVLWTLRGTGTLLFSAILWRFYRRPLPSPALFRLLNTILFTYAAAAVAAMCFEYGGIASPYPHGISCVLLAYGVTNAADWRRGTLMLAFPALSFPIVLGIGALVSPTFRSQFANPALLAVFLQNVFLIFASWFLLVLGGHVVWDLRRQVLEAHDIGRYKLRTRIGRGGMGEVWRAYHPGLKREVALKILRAEPDRFDEALARFEREVRATTELSHPNTIRIFDYGATEDGLWYYAMELLEGQTLGALVKENGPLPSRRALVIALQAARALTEAHEHGIIHRDIKPENLFIVNVSGEGDFLKLLDFGIAKDIGKEGGTLTNIGALMGTPMYMAPEQVRNDVVDARTDVYSLGAVLYKALTGHPPFEKKTSLSMLEAQLMEPASPPSVWLEVSPCLEAVVMKCLEKKPADRFESAAQLAEALTACLRDESIRTQAS
jgi:hypothetical protein